MGKSHIEINGNELGEAIQCVQKIDEALKNALAKGKSLNDDLLGNAAWSGKNKKAFLAYMDIVLQYQRKMTTMTSKHTDTLKSLQKQIATFSQTDEVSKIKGL
ncbi:WXG100 family type VII secretion target [Sporolactobacillus shoreicorticis]|uniref:WXG100 family type VII secretion target n=1 Tax=Sporolactobacillus shoreicorticis TaxID=1923877 RepID=A0ABW5S3C0_9BACL|nr:WXG100 family type VII secretion target [Sporolactobacillus shoreicorticis]MCO7127669.1 WXG100 family type VII secretion target [Sporolactobacillus shoreicorticis]